MSDIHHNKPTISFEEEYRKLPWGQHFPWTVAMRQENNNRNRFEHLLAYDHSRVRLKGRYDDETDYINANYINGFVHKKAYIAAQSPYNPDTVYDFWYMVYTENIEQIVFLACLMEDGVVKCEQYWPDPGTFQTENIVVRHIETELYANFVIRTFDVLLEGQELKRVVQYHFTQWPEHGIPDDPIPFLEFRRKVRGDAAVPERDTNAPALPPVLVHCGTGVSRTAVYIAVDSLLDQAKLEQSVNVFKFCQTMRHMRPNMVRTLKQYIFIYDALFEALITNYNIIGDNLKVNYRQLSQVNPITDKSYFREQFEVLEQYLPDVNPDDYKTALKESNAAKNRFSAIVPPDRYRLKLHTQGGLGRNDYFNAVFVDSFTTPNAFVLTQTPLENTVADFWKMVYDYKVSDDVIRCLRHTRVRY